MAVDGQTILVAILASTVAGSMTGLGAVPVLVTNNISPKLQAGMLGFGAGVMLAATSFSLIVPAVETAAVQAGNTLGAGFIVVAGTLLGGVFIFLGHRFSPHQHFIKGTEGRSSDRLSRIWLFIIAIIIHNFPEGLAVGVAFGLDQVKDALALTIGIGLQNMPEGLIIAVALVCENYPKWKAILIALLTGLMQPLGAFIGITFVSISQPLLPWGLAFAAGAMLYVISNEVIPESHRQGFEQASTAGLLLGFVLMIFLDTSLGA